MDEQLQQQLWDYAYGLLTATEAEELELRIGSEPDVARAYAEVRLKADMLGEASRVVKPTIVLSEAAAEPASNGRAAVSPFRQAAPVRTLSRGNWFVAAAASFVAVCSLLGAGQRAEPRRMAANGTRNIQRYTEVTVPASMEAGSRNVVLIRSLNAAHQPGPTDVVYRILDDQLRSQYESERITAPTTGAVIETPELSNNARFIEVFTKDSPSLRIPINTVSEAVTARITPDQLRYEPGEKIQFRIQTLSRYSHQPAANVAASTELLNGQGDVLAVAKVTTDDQGVFEGQLPAPASGGKYVLKSQNDALLFAPTQTQIFVSEAFQAEQPPYRLQFARDSYQPGEDVDAELVWEEAPQLGLKGKLEAWTYIDGIEDQVTVESATSGKSRFRFKLPEIVNHEARLSIRAGGDAGQTIVRTIPVAAADREVVFLPEGGQLVNGVTNRVFFAARSTKGEWSYLEGTVQDDLGNEVANVKVAHEGRGSFLLQPQSGRSYRLHIEGPGQLTAALPKAVDDGIAIMADPAVFAPEQPVRFLALGVPANRQLLAVAECRGVTVGQKRWVSTGDSEGDTIRLDIPGSAAGVIRVTILQRAGQQWEPKAERLMFRRDSRRLAMTLAQRRDSSQLDMLYADLTVQDENGNGVSDAVVGAWARPMTEDGWLSRETPNMAAYFSLASELSSAADVEKINAAFGLADEQANEYLELLLGADGWRRFAPTNETADGEAASATGAAAPVEESIIEQSYTPPRTFDNQVTLSRTQAAASSPIASAPWRSLVIAGCLLGLFVILLMGLLRMAESRVCVPAFAMASVVLLGASMMRFQPGAMIASRIETATDSAAPTAKPLAPDEEAVDEATLDMSEADSPPGSEGEVRKQMNGAGEGPEPAVDASVNELAEQLDGNTKVETLADAFGGRLRGSRDRAAESAHEGIATRKEIKKESQAGESQPARSRAGGAEGANSLPFRASDQPSAEKANDKSNPLGRDGPTKKDGDRTSVRRAQANLATQLDQQLQSSTAESRKSKTPTGDLDDQLGKQAGMKAESKPLGGVEMTRQRKTAGQSQRFGSGPAGVSLADDKAKVGAAGANDAAKKAAAGPAGDAGGTPARAAAANAPLPTQPAKPPRVVQQSGSRGGTGSGGTGSGGRAMPLTLQPQQSPASRATSRSPSPTPGIVNDYAESANRYKQQAGFGGGAGGGGVESGGEVNRMQLQLQEANTARFAEEERVLGENSRRFRRQLVQLNLAKRIDEASTADFYYWNPKARTNADGKLTLAIPNPPGAPARRLTADAFGLGRLGDVESTLEARTGLLASLTAPNTVTFGDQIRAPLILYNNSSQPLDVNVKLAEADGLKVDEADREFKVRLEPGRQALRRDIRVSPTANAQDARFAYQVTAGAEQQKFEKSLRVDPRGYPVDRFHAGVVESTRDWTVKVPSNQPTEITLQAFPTLMAELQFALKNPAIRTGDYESAKRVADLSLDYLKSKTLPNDGATRDALTRAAQGVLADSRGYLKEQLRESAVQVDQESTLSREALARLTESEALGVEDKRRLLAVLRNVSKEDLAKLAQSWRARNFSTANEDRGGFAKNSSVADNSAAAIAMKGREEYRGDRREALKKIVAGRQVDGGFGKPDDTALALQALFDNEVEMYHVAPDAQVAVKINGKQVAAKSLNSLEAVRFQRLEEFTKPGENQLSMAIGEGNRAPFLSLARTWAPNAPEGRPDLNLQVQLSRSEAKLGDSIEVRVLIENRGKEPAPLVANVTLPGGLFLRTRRLEELKRAEQVDHYESTTSNAKLFWRAFPAGERRELVFDAVVGAAGRYTSTPASLYRQDDQTRPKFAEPSSIVVE